MIRGMAEPEPSATRRRRRRGASSQGAAEQERPAEPDPAPPAKPRSTPRAKPRSAPRGEPTDRGLRGLVGAGPSQLGVSGALRGRDVNRPGEEDLAEAERAVVLVRRNWKPPA